MFEAPIAPLPPRFCFSTEEEYLAAKGREAELHRERDRRRNTEFAFVVVAAVAFALMIGWMLIATIFDIGGYWAVARILGGLGVFLVLSLCVRRFL